MALLNPGEPNCFLMPEASTVSVTLRAAVLVTVSLYLVYRVWGKAQKHAHGTDRAVVRAGSPLRYQLLLLQIDMSLMPRQQLR